MKQHIIGLTGFASVGKDTVANLLATHFAFRTIAFADALRAEVAAGFQFDIFYLLHPSTKNEPIAALSMRRAPREFLAAVVLAVPGIPRGADGQIDATWLDTPRSPRQIMQWWGTEFRRAQDTNYWTRALVSRIVYLQRDGGQRFVITDCRFDNEVDRVLAMGGVLWQVTRPGIDVSTTAEGAHVSATSGSKFKPSVVIHNQHDIAHLQRIVFGEFLTLETGVEGLKVTA